MNRSQLEHLIRAAGAIAQDSDIVVIGSQSILGSIENPPPSLTLSNEGDMFPRTHVERADDIDVMIGEGSQFHDQYGYYAQGVGPETATLPSSWKSRLHPLRTPNTNGVTGHCLDPHDLALAKYAAGRDKDLAFNRVLVAHGYVERAKLQALVSEMSITPAVEALIRERIGADFARAQQQAAGMPPETPSP